MTIVNETFVRRFFGGGSPLGRTIIVYPNTPRALHTEIVGVVADAVYTSPRESAPATWYLPIAQFDIPGLSFASARCWLPGRNRFAGALDEECLGGNRRGESAPGPDVSAPL